MTEHNPDAHSVGIDGTMTERNSSLTGIVRTDGEGTQLARMGRGGEPFRSGEEIALAKARPAVSSGKLDDEVRGNFSPVDIGQTCLPFTAR